MPPEERFEPRGAARKPPVPRLDLVDSNSDSDSDSDSDADSYETRERAGRPAAFDTARATSPNAAYLRPVAPVDPGPPAQSARPHPDAPPLDERAEQRSTKPFVRGLPEDPAVRRLAANPDARGRIVRIVVIVALAAVALWLVLS